MFVYVETGSPISQASLELRAPMSVLPTPPKVNTTTWVCGLSGESQGFWNVRETLWQLSYTSCPDSGFLLTHLVKVADDVNLVKRNEEFLLLIGFSEIRNTVTYFRTLASPPSQVLHAQLSMPVFTGFAIPPRPMTTFVSAALSPLS